LDLSPSQIAAAHACGVSFFPASPDQIHRFQVQRRLFQRDGRIVVATRNGAFYETHATLLHLIRDVVLEEAAPQAAPEPPPAITAEEPAPAPDPASGPALQATEVPAEAPAESAPVVKRPRKPRAPRAAAPAPQADLLPEADMSAAPEAEASAEPEAEDDTGAEKGARTRAPRKADLPRWQTAGAERRGRLKQALKKL